MLKRIHSPTAGRHDAMSTSLAARQPLSKSIKRPIESVAKSFHSYSACVRHARMMYIHSRNYNVINTIICFQRFPAITWAMK
jgi:hypothetical protein